MKTKKAQQPSLLRIVLRRSMLGVLAAWAVLIGTMLMAPPVMASNTVQLPSAFATMANKADAAAKTAEGKLESAYGELTGDAGRQIKGKAKQVQGSAMNAAEDVKQGIKSSAKNIADAADKLADNLN
jgi:uncharacterized protein YjbJ (UPF0337 family)